MSQPNTKTEHTILIDSRMRRNGSASKYYVELPSAVHNVKSASLQWIQFFDANNRAHVDVFVGNPYVALCVDPFVGTHQFSVSSDKNVLNAFAIIHRDFDVGNNPYTDTQCASQLERLQRLNIALYGIDGNLLDSDGTEHVFMIKIVSLCDGSQDLLPWGRTAI